MSYAKACEDYEYYRGRGFGVCLVRSGNEFHCDILPGCPLILRAGGEGWEEVRGRTNRIVDVAEMPIRLQSRGSFVEQLNARKEVLGS